MANSTSVPKCTAAMEHTTCSTKGKTLSTIVIDAGYWRATESSRDVLECYNPASCLGGVTGAPGNCKEGYEGPCEYSFPLISVLMLVFTACAFIGLCFSEHEEREQGDRVFVFQCSIFALLALLFLYVTSVRVIPYVSKLHMSILSMVYSSRHSAS